MEHHRPRKYRGPGVWALVRDAYLAGEPAPKVAQRYDVGLANLRRKALQEGWTRRAYAYATDSAPAHTKGARPPPPPAAPAIERPMSREEIEAAMEAGITRASHLLREGKGSEAQAILRAVETLRTMVVRVREALEGWCDPSEPDDVDTRWI